MGGGVFDTYFTSDYPALILVVINSVNIPKLSLLCPQWYLGRDLSQSLCQSMNLLLYFLSRVQLQRGVVEWLWWVPGIHYSNSGF